MKTGEISDDGPCITCKFHGTALMLIAHDFCYFSQFFTGSKFDLKTGKAVKWSESVLGLPGTQFLGNIVGNVSHHRNLAPHRIEISQTPALPLRHTSAQLRLPPPCQETIAERPTELHPPHNSRAQHPTRRLLRPALMPDERARTRRRSTDAPRRPRRRRRRADRRRQGLAGQGLRRLGRPRRRHRRRHGPHRLVRRARLLRAPSSAITFPRPRPL